MDVNVLESLMTLLSKCRPSCSHLKVDWCWVIHAQGGYTWLLGNVLRSFLYGSLRGLPEFSHGVVLITPGVTDQRETNRESKMEATVFRILI